MNKRFQDLSWLTAVVDQAAVYACLALIRFLAPARTPALFWSRYDLILGLSAALCFSAFGLYTRWLNEPLTKLWLRLLVASFPVLCMAGLVGYHAFRARWPMVLLSATLQAVLFASGRASIWTAYWKRNRRQKLLVISRHKTRGLDLAGWLIERQRLRFAEFRVVGQDKIASTEIETTIRWADVVLLDGEVENKDQLLKLCTMQCKYVEELPRPTDVLQPSIVPGKYGEKLTLTRAPLQLSRLQRANKRIFDLLFSLGALACLAPVILIITIAIKLTSPGPVFYQQERVGREGKRYRVLKFRTMIDRAEARSGPVMAQLSDSRITPLGHFLRATRLDETPQFINVLLGNMSVVGPRPERRCFVDVFEAEDPLYQLRHNVKPGITGLAQVMGNYSTSAKDKLKLDLLYIQRYSWLMDVGILFETIIVVLQMGQAKGFSTPPRLRAISPTPAMTMEEVPVAVNERD